MRNVVRPPASLVRSKAGKGSVRRADDARRMARAHMKPVVYILTSLKDKKRYIGSTNDIQRRMIQHENGEVKSTKNRRPLQLIHTIEYDTLTEARMMEVKFKRSRGTLEKVLSTISGCSSDG